MVDCFFGCQSAERMLEMNSTCLRFASVLLVILVWLNGVQLRPATDGRAADSHQWLPFECDNQQAADIHLGKSGRFLIFESNLYFYFKVSVFRMDSSFEMLEQPDELLCLKLSETTIEIHKLRSTKRIC